MKMLRPPTPSLPPLIRQRQTRPPPPTGDSEKPAEAPAKDTSEAPAEKSDVEMTDAAAPAEAQAATADPSTAAAIAEPAGTAALNDSKAKRKSVGGGADMKGKKLNKKASKARILHLDAKPGDHFYVKLKGFPQWPVIICDEDMLPASLLRSRPVTAKRIDGTYRDDYADGSKKVGDRTFPVMYLSTNEFGWVPNWDLIDLDFDAIKEMKMDKMRKDLQLAYELAAENHPLDYYKEVLQQYQDDLMEQEKAKEAKAAAKAAKATPKGKKSKATVDEDGDVDMEDVADEEAPAKEPKQKKRKAEESAEPPQRSESVKKPKIKLTVNSTPKANGTPTPAKTTKAAEPKAQKSKTTKKVVEEDKDANLSPEEKRARKEKEVLFLRHKLQKGLLTRDQEPKESEMDAMSGYIQTLEDYPELDVSIIRATKINKVLKAILKLNNIPKDGELKMKERSQALLEKWNKVLESAPAPAATEGANGINGTKEAKTNGANGVKEASEAAPAEKAKEEAKEVPKADAKVEPKEVPKEVLKEVSKADEAPAEAANPYGEDAAEPVAA